MAYTDGYTGGYAGDGEPPEPATIRVSAVNGPTTGTLVVGPAVSPPITGPGV